MQSIDLNERQLTTLLNQLRRITSYLSKLETRMADRGFRIDDPLRIAAIEAREKMRTLSDSVHGLTCRDWGGWKPK